MSDTSAIDEQLKSLCKLIDAAWAVWLDCAGEEWPIVAQSGLTRPRAAAVTAALRQPLTRAWLAGALSSGRTRQRAADGDLGAARLYLVPNGATRTALLLGAKELSKTALGFGRILVQTLGPAPAPAAGSVIPPPATLARLAAPPNPLRLPLTVNGEVSYDPEPVFDWILANLHASVSFRGGMVVMRTAGVWRIRGVRGYPASMVGEEIVFHDQEALLEAVAAGRSQCCDAPAALPGYLFPTPEAKRGLVAPMMVDGRLIGVAALMRVTERAFSAADGVHAQQLLGWLGQTAENAIAFAEIAQYLQQFTLLTELAAAASSGAEMSAVAERVVQRLQQAFHSEYASLILRDPERASLRHYGRGSLTCAGKSIEECDLLRAVLESGAALRLNDEHELSHIRRSPGIRSALVTPLKYRAQVVGAIVLESGGRARFSGRDEQLLSVIASSLAGMFENLRLYNETLERARNLALIHRVAQQLVGQLDLRTIAEITARQMGDFFAYDFATFCVPDATGEWLIDLGVGGSQAHKLDLLDHSRPVGGIMGHVLRSGRRYYAPDVTVDPYFIACADFTAGSEVCVPLHDGARVVGLLDLKRAQLDGFARQELIILESLAGLLASVMVNARQHDEMNESVRQLQAVRATALEIAGNLGMMELFERVLGRVRELAHAGTAGLALQNSVTGQVELFVSRAVLGMDAAPILIPDGRGLTGKVWAHGETVEVQNYPEWAERLEEKLTFNFTAAAGVPLKLQDEVIGALLVFDLRPGRGFERGEIRILELLAPQVSISIQNARLYQDLTEANRELVMAMDARLHLERRLLQGARLAALGEMSAGVAHELNNPLTMVSGFLELALDEIPPDLPQRTELGLAQSEAARAIKVVRNLLDFARQREPLREQTQINTLVEQVVMLVRHQAMVGGVTLRQFLTEDLPVVWIDPTQMKQVLINLLQNALQAMRQGGVLTLRTAAEPYQQQAGVVFSVEDTGHGISAADQERIFEPFFTTRPVGEGTGLGLAVSYGLVTEHGGRMDVESVPEQGSIFRVWLPLQPNDRRAKPRPGG
jgi:signal transduction histidine kinase/putative methionine-R-sulfoxide reductase with GAF domain